MYTSVVSDLNCLRSIYEDFLTIFIWLKEIHVEDSRQKCEHIYMTSSKSSQEACDRAREVPHFS